MIVFIIGRSRPINSTFGFREVSGVRVFENCNNL